MSINSPQPHLHFNCLFLLLLFVYILMLYTTLSAKVRNTELFIKNWKFYLGNIPDAYEPKFDDTKWRLLNLPHDWSIEGEFNKDNPATIGGGALPGGIGWYRKTFSIPAANKDKLIYIEFDGIYRNSEVWINGHYYSSNFNYEIPGEGKGYEEYNDF